MANRITFDEWCRDFLRVDPYSLPDDCFDAVVDEWHDYQQLLKESYEKNKENTEQPIQ